MTEWAVELKDVKKTYRAGSIEVSALRQGCSTLTIM
jgi:hypothetical protein